MSSNNDLGAIRELIGHWTRYCRMYRGRVVSVDDPIVRGRVKCVIEELGWFEDSEAPWCDPVYRGGSICVPKLGTYVLVYFMAGNNARPVWDGVLGEIKDQVATEYSSPQKRVIYSRDGRYIIHDEDADALILEGFGEVRINGNSKTFVTYPELNSALSSFLGTLNTQLGSIAAGATAAVAAGGLWLTPLAIGGITLDISLAEAKDIKTGD
jgi:hypothetical protein